MGYDAALRAFDATLERLGTGYLDLYLIHWPRPDLELADWPGWTGRPGGRWSGCMSPARCVPSG